MAKIKVLFLAANPDGSQLQLNKEVREITAKIQASELRDSLKFITRWAVKTDDLQQALLEVKPHILHFSGHGTKDESIIVLDDADEPKPVAKEALSHLLSVLKDNLRLVVLNACYSRPQGEAIVECIDCAVGMNEAIGDEAAILFAGSLYRALGFGRTIKEAFELGISSLKLAGIPEDRTPDLLVREGVDPSAMVLVKVLNPLPVVAGQVLPFSVVRGDEQPPPHRPLLRDLERSITSGELRDSLIAPIILAALTEENELELENGYESLRQGIIGGIRLSDEYFIQVRSSAGQRDWQRDFAQTAAPALVGVTKAVKRSAPAQALVIRLCNDVAARLRVELDWPEDPDRYNDVANAIYSACLQATELDSDDVLLQLKGLNAVGPK